MRIPLCGGWEGEKKVDVVTGRVCFDEYVPVNSSLFLDFRISKFSVVGLSVSSVGALWCVSCCDC